MQKTALFFAPHPDDLEFGVSYYFMSLLEEQNYRVIQISMTDGAFGTTNPDFKGKRIVKIRKKELEKANHVFQNAFQKEIKIIRLGYTDGYLPFTKATRDKIIQIIREYDPNIVFAPDPWFSIDFHPDHLNTGRLVILALKKIASSLSVPIPLILYYTYAQNRFIRVKPKYLKILSKALSKHQSQISPFQVKLLMNLLVYLVFGKNYIIFRRMVKGYRLQEYNQKNEPIFPPKFEDNSIINRMKYHLFHLPTMRGYEKLHNLEPSEIGIEIKR